MQLLGMGAFAVLYGLARTVLALGVIAVPVGLAVFRAGERHAKRHGKLKRSG